MTEYAPSVFRALNGIFCIYKPAGRAVPDVVRTLKMNLARGNIQLILLWYTEDAVQTVGLLEFLIYFQLLALLVQFETIVFCFNLLWGIWTNSG